MGGKIESNMSWIQLIIPPEKPNKTLGCPIVNLYGFSTTFLYSYLIILKIR